MARQLEDDYDFAAKPQVVTKYPWPEWTNGKVWEVLEGEDFQMSAKSFRNYLHNIARQRSIHGRGLGEDDLKEGLELRCQASIRSVEGGVKRKKDSSSGEGRKWADKKVIFRFFEQEEDFYEDEEELDEDSSEVDESSGYMEDPLDETIDTDLGASSDEDAES